MATGAMIPVGYLAKKSVARPEGLLKQAPLILDVFSVSSCINADFADYLDFWKHNGFWLFDSPEVIRQVCVEHEIKFDELLLFYYESYSLQFDGEAWEPFNADASFPTSVSLPPSKLFQGFDVVTFYAGNAPECSPLSCNGLAEEIRTNSHCLLETFEDAKVALESGAFIESEPGPYRIFAVYSIAWPGRPDDRTQLKPSTGCGIYGASRAAISSFVRWRLSAATASSR